MTTKNQYIEQARAANPKPQYATINGERIELSHDEYEASLSAWADMRVKQDEVAAEAARISAAKQAAYAKLGLSEAELAALLGV